jgi:uncharacterized RmlC-like cupin family protein
VSLEWREYVTGLFCHICHFLRVASRFVPFPKRSTAADENFHMLSGDEMELWTGDQLQYHDIVKPGDYIFIPTNMLHVAVNRSDEAAVFMGARNEATAQESVVLRPEMDQRVP